MKILVFIYKSFTTAAILFVYTACVAIMRHPFARGRENNNRVVSFLGKSATQILT